MAATDADAYLDLGLGAMAGQDAFWEGARQAVPLQPGAAVDARAWPGHPGRVCCGDL